MGKVYIYDQGKRLGDKSCRRGLLQAPNDGVFSLAGTALFFSDGQNNKHTFSLSVFLIHVQICAKHIHTKPESAESIIQLKIQHTD